MCCRSRLGSCASGKQPDTLHGALLQQPRRSCRKMRLKSTPTPACSYRDTPAFQSRAGRLAQHPNFDLSSTRFHPQRDSEIRLSGMLRKGRGRVNTLWLVKSLISTIKG